MDLTSLQVCMDSSDWLQGTINEDYGMDSSSQSGDILTCTRPLNESRRLRPQHDQALKCPRCDSTHTKFCYYNNYSLSQPRYFCKACRRYWTKGGILRNIPLGGGCRKNKNKSTSNSKKSSNDHQPPIINPTHLGSPSSSVHNNLTDLQLSFPEDQISQFNYNSLVGNPNNGILLDQNPRAIDFMMESKLEALVGINNGRNYDFMGNEELGMIDHHHHHHGIGDDHDHHMMNGHNLAPLNFHGLCYNGMSTLDHPGNSSNESFMDTCQRIMLPYHEANHEDQNAINVKPNTKLLALEWAQSDAAKDSFGYVNGSSWNAVINGCGPSTTNHLV